MSNSNLTWNSTERTWTGQSWSWLCFPMSQEQEQEEQEEQSSPNFALQKRPTGFYLERVKGWVSGMFLEGIWRVSGKCLECAILTYWKDQTLFVTINFFEHNFFYTQNFCNPNFMWSKKFWDPNFFETQNILSLHIFRTQKVFWATIF